MGGHGGLSHPHYPLTARPALIACRMLNRILVQLGTLRNGAHARRTSGDWGFVSDPQRRIDLPPPRPAVACKTACARTAR